MKYATTLVGAVLAALLLVAVPNQASAGNPVALPEPTSLIVWGALAAAAGAGCWWQSRRKR